MLSLTLNLGEKVYIGDDIVITVVSIDRVKTRLGIDAPKEIPIIRDELLPPNDPRKELGRK